MKFSWLFAVIGEPMVVLWDPDIKDVFIDKM